MCQRLTFLRWSIWEPNYMYFWWPKYYYIYFTTDKIWKIDTFWNTKIFKVLHLSFCYLFYFHQLFLSLNLKPALALFSIRHLLWAFELVFACPWQSAWSPREPQATKTPGASSHIWNDQHAPTHLQVLRH